MIVIVFNKPNKTLFRCLVFVCECVCCQCGYIFCVFEKVHRESHARTHTHFIYIYICTHRYHQNACDTYLELITIVNKSVVQMFILTDKREGIYVVGDCIYNLIHA